MRNVSLFLAAAAAMILLAAAPKAVMAYSCDTGPGKGGCSCLGTDDCVTMRHSGQCNGPANCKGAGDGTSCTCAAMVVKAPTGGGTDKKLPPFATVPSKEAKAQ
jgi:hypothetical protein